MDTGLESMVWSFINVYLHLFLDAFEAIHEGAQDVKWTIDWKVTKASEHEFVSIVIFPLDKLRNVFKNSKYGLQIKQTMCALWLENNCDVIARVRTLNYLLF